MKQSLKTKWRQVKFLSVMPPCMFAVLHLMKGKDKCWFILLVGWWPLKPLNGHIV